MGEILDFVSEFSQFGEEVKRCFTSGCCYYFALSLYERFKDERECYIAYDLIEGHFSCYIDGSYYDITGRINPDPSNMVPWDYLKEYDEARYERIMRDCVKKTGTKLYF